MSKILRAIVSRSIPLLLAALLPLAIQAQSARPESVGISKTRLARINQLIERYMAAGEISGAVTLVARNGRVVHLQAQGVTNLETNTPMRTDTIFRIASMTKPVAGVAILMLVEQGRIRLLDPVSKFLPSFKGQNVGMIRPAPPPAAGAPPEGPTPADVIYTVPAEREITILDLLTHTSGLLSGPISNPAGAAAVESRAKVGLKWVDGIGAGPLEFQPGARWQYSPGGGFDTLARIVEIVSGETFNEFVTQRIFRPLGMRDIFFWPTDAQRARLVTPYALTDGKLTLNEVADVYRGPNYFSGGGGLMSTAEAYARFAMMLANRGELDGVRILSPRWLELMGSAYVPDTLPGRPPGEGYGLSVRVITDPAARRTTLSKGSFGWSGAFGTHFWADPEKNLTGILMVQTPRNQLRADFEDAVMQALVE
jgi:CubicO group peptidase (beta-lactamase class C family)